MPFVWCVRCEPSFARTPGKFFFRKEDETTGFLSKESREIDVYEVRLLPNGIDDLTDAVEDFIHGAQTVDVGEFSLFGVKSATMAVCS